MAESLAAWVCLLTSLNGISWLETESRSISVNVPARMSTYFKILIQYDGGHSEGAPLTPFHHTKVEHPPRAFVAVVAIPPLASVVGWGTPLFPPFFRPTLSNLSSMAPHVFSMLEIFIIFLICSWYVSSAPFYQTSSAATSPEPTLPHLPSRVEITRDFDGFCQLLFQPPSCRYDFQRISKREILKNVILFFIQRKIGRLFCWIFEDRTQHRYVASVLRIIVIRC